MTFKVGDRVKVKRWKGDTPYTVEGVIGGIAPRSDTESDEYWVKHDSGYGFYYWDSELTLIEQGEISGFTSNYYDFPGGVEVRQISAHLTGFGAQALQYVARSTRLDGKNKGDVVSDLRKAIDFITWEIERLEGTKDGD